MSLTQQAQSGSAWRNRVGNYWSLVRADALRQLVNAPVPKRYEHRSRVHLVHRDRDALRVLQGR